MLVPAFISLLTFGSVFNSLHVLAQDEESSIDVDLYDFSWIKKWAAVGDSYAAGIGAGNSYGIGAESRASYDCSRYDGSYPNLINLQLGTDPNSIDFTFRAYSGAVTSEVIDQVKRLSSEQQMITISSGGNDAGLSRIINDCVYTWRAMFSGDCNNSLDKAQSVMESDKFTSNLDTLLDTAKSKLASNGTIQDYNAKTPNAVTISTKWPTGDRNFQIFEEECRYYLSTIMDGCDTADNAMNWKHGGYMNDNNGVTYTIKPLAERPSPPDSPQGSCAFKFSFAHHHFEISGGGWADADKGAALKKQLDGCGWVTRWKFHFLSMPDGTSEFKAQGNVNQMMKGGCTERAIASAGGPKSLKCS